MKILSKTLTKTRANAKKPKNLKKNAGQFIVFLIALASSFAFINLIAALLFSYTDLFGRYYWLWLIMSIAGLVFSLFYRKESIAQSKARNRVSESEDDMKEIPKIAYEETPEIWIGFHSPGYADNDSGHVWTIESTYDLNGNTVSWVRETKAFDVMAKGYFSRKGIANPTKEQMNGFRERFFRSTSKIISNSAYTFSANNHGRN